MDVTANYEDILHIPVISIPLSRHETARTSDKITLPYILISCPILLTSYLHPHNFFDKSGFSYYFFYISLNHNYTIPQCYTLKQRNQSNKTFHYLPTTTVLTSLIPQHPLIRSISFHTSRAVLLRSSVSALFKTTLYCMSSATPFRPP